MTADGPGGVIRTVRSAPAQAAGELVIAEEKPAEPGKTAIADTVVAKIAGIAAREVPGIYAMETGMARAFGAVRGRLPGVSPAPARGVSVEVGDRQAAVDLDLIVEYGVSIPEVAAAVRQAVITAVEGMCGLEVTEVNIAVGDVHLPGDDEPEPQAEPRAR